MNTLNRFTISNVYNVKLLIARENLLKQKSIPKSLNASIAKTNKIINQDLQLKKAKCLMSFVKECGSIQGIL